MVKVLLNGAEYSASSINGVVQEVATVKGLKSPAGMNRTAALKWLKRNGVDSVYMDGEPVDLDNIKTKGRAASTSLIERIIKNAVVIDTALIAKLENDNAEATKNAKTVNDLKAIQETLKEIERLKNPAVNLDTVLAHVEKLFNDYQATLTAETESDNETDSATNND